MSHTKRVRPESLHVSQRCFSLNVPSACRDTFRSDLQACELHHLTQGTLHCCTYENHIPVAGHKVSAGEDNLQEMKNLSMGHKSAEDKTPAETHDAPMVAKSETAHAAATKLDDIGVSSETKDNHPAVAHAVHGVVESAAVPATAHLEDHPVFEPTREVMPLPYLCQLCKVVLSLEQFSSSALTLIVPV